MFLCVGSLSDVGGKEHTGACGISAKKPGVAPPGLDQPPLLWLTGSKIVFHAENAEAIVLSPRWLFFPCSIRSMPKTTYMDETGLVLEVSFRKGARLSYYKTL